MNLTSLMVKRFYVQPVKFMVIGIINTLVSFLVYSLMLIVLKSSYFTSLVFSYIIGVANSYVWNSKWTFGNRTMHFPSLIKFVTVYAATFMVNLLILRFMIEDLGISAFFSQGFSLCLATIFSFMGHKYWSFKDKTVNITKREK